MASHFESLMDQAVIHLNLSPEAEAAMRENWKVEQEEMMAFWTTRTCNLPSRPKALPPGEQTSVRALRQGPLLVKQRSTYLSLGDKTDPEPQCMDKNNV
jgi:hypothetical protein